MLVHEADPDNLKLKVAEVLLCLRAESWHIFNDTANRILESLAVCWNGPQMSMFTLSFEGTVSKSALQAGKATNVPSFTSELKPLVAFYVNAFSQIDSIDTFRIAENALNVGLFGILIFSSIYTVLSLWHRLYPGSVLVQIIWYVPGSMLHLTCTFQNAT